MRHPHQGNRLLGPPLSPSSAVPVLRKAPSVARVAAGAFGFLTSSRLLISPSDTARRDLEIVTGSHRGSARAPSLGRLEAAWRR
jgi:hypothetical protein